MRTRLVTRGPDGRLHQVSPESTVLRSLAHRYNMHDELVGMLVTLLEAMNAGPIDARSQPFGDRKTYGSMLKKLIEQSTEVP